MKLAKRLSLLIIAAFATLWVIPAFAGGWAVVTLDSLPAQVVASEPLTVGFVVRQHGNNPLTGLNASVGIQQEGSVEWQWIPATEDLEPGHYSATVNFPTSGTWHWTIGSGFWPESQPMPDLTVLEASGVTAVAQTTPSHLPFVLGGVGLVGLAGSLVALVRTKSPWAAAGALAAALIGGFGFVLAVPQTSASEPQVVVAPPIVSVEQGERLFVAKGCVVCHTHDAVADVKQTIAFNYEDAPNLTNFTADPNYLAKWLDDPAAVKPGTFMPKLNLSDDEIGALVLFINAP